MSLYSGPNQLDRPRLGFSVSTKVGGAVVRNAVKRRLREASREWLEAHAGEALDLVVVARSEAARAVFADLRDDLLELLATVASSPLEDRARTPR